MTAFQRAGHDGNVQGLADDIIKELQSRYPSPHDFQRNLKVIMAVLDPTSASYDLSAILTTGKDPRHTPQLFVQYVRARYYPDYYLSN